jgi:hypothetical protein
MVISPAADGPAMSAFRHVPRHSALLWTDIRGPVIRVTVGYPYEMDGSRATHRVLWPAVALGAVGGLLAARSGISTAALLILVLAAVAFQALLLSAAGKRADRRVGAGPPRGWGGVPRGWGSDRDPWGFNGAAVRRAHTAIRRGEPPDASGRDLAVDIARTWARYRLASTLRLAFACLLILVVIVVFLRLHASVALLMIFLIQFGNGVGRQVVYAFRRRWAIAWLARYAPGEATVPRPA